jgi:hypothetical protein
MTASEVDEIFVKIFEDQVGRVGSGNGKQVVGCSMLKERVQRSRS